MTKNLTVDGNEARTEIHRPSLATVQTDCGIFTSIESLREERGPVPVAFEPANYLETLDSFYGSS